MPYLKNHINKIIRGDCLQVMKRLPDQCVDFVLTDPPYLVNYQSRDGRSIAGDRNSHWLVPAFAELYRLLKDNRFLVSFYGWQASDRFFYAWRRAGFRPVAHLVWVKPYASGQGFVKYHHESAYLLAKGQPRRPAWAIRDVRTWEYSGNRLHPTQKPVSALLPLIEAFSCPGDTVLDPFAGSGTTAVAAKKMGRHYIAIELDFRYYKKAAERLQRDHPR